MSSSEGKTASHLAAWANLPLRDRVADRFAAIIFAAEQIQSMLDIEGPLEDAPFDIAGTARAVSGLVRSVFPLLSGTMLRLGERDPELEEVLVRLDRDLNRVDRLRGPECDEAREEVERWAAPYALAFYCELRRLDDLRIWGVWWRPYAGK